MEIKKHQDISHQTDRNIQSPDPWEARPVQLNVALHFCILKHWQRALVISVMPALWIAFFILLQAIWLS